MTGFAPSVRGMVGDRSGGWCELCGLKPAQEAHHRRPRASGGSRRATTNLASNALALCNSCHRMVESYRDVAGMLGWLVPQAVDNPCAVKVLYRGEYGWLDDHGSFTPMEGAHHG